MTWIADGGAISGMIAIGGTLLTWTYRKKLKPYVEAKQSFDLAKQTREIRTIVNDAVTQSRTVMLDEIDSKLSPIRGELKNNGGSSLKDAVKRLESGQRELADNWQHRMEMFDMVQIQLRTMAEEFSRMRAEMGDLREGLRVLQQSSDRAEDRDALR